MDIKKISLHINIYTIVERDNIMNDNNVKALKIAEHIDKKYGVIVYSGTLAIEAALVCLNIKKNDKVLVSSTVCYSIIEAILRVGAIPVIVVPEKYFSLSEKDIEKVLNKEKNIKCIILVHQYGIAQEIKEIKKKAGEIPLIEDIAQAWNIENNNEKPGKHSDIVITSFGITKPLSLGYGGALFSNTNYNKYFDFYDSISRHSSEKLLPYTLNIKNSQIKKILKKSHKIVKRQRKIAKILSEGLKDINSIDYIKDDIYTKSVWHRFPIFISNKKEYKKILSLLEKNKVLYQLPHEKELFELDLIKNSSSIVYKDNYHKENIILIRTRTNKTKNIKKFLKEVK